MFSVDIFNSLEFLCTVNPSLGSEEAELLGLVCRLFVILAPVELSGLTSVG